MANHAQVISNFFAENRNERHFTKSANTFFEGDTLYSYGYHFPMARFVTNSAGQRAILITTARYSVTTARHLSLVRKAADETRLPVLFVPKLSRRSYALGAMMELETVEALEAGITEHKENAAEAAAKRDRARSEYRKEDYQREIRFAETQIEAISRFLKGSAIGTNPVFPHFNTSRSVA